MAELLKPDICVIGAGAGGLSVAAAAAAFGVQVVLVERGKMGGDCLNAGCVPSKSLIASARRARMIAQADLFGLGAEASALHFDRVRAHVHGVIAAIAPNDSKERYIGLGVRVIEGCATFVDPRTVAVGEAVRIRARRFVIATGSAPALPPISGLESTPHLTNETIFDLDHCPEHLVVIGAGAVGLELAQAFRRLGAEVTVLEAAKPLAREDPECAQIVVNALAREGIAFRTGVVVKHVGEVQLAERQAGELWAPEVKSGETRVTEVEGSEAHSGEVQLAEAQASEVQSGEIQVTEEQAAEAQAEGVQLDEAQAGEPQSSAVQSRLQVVLSGANGEETIEASHLLVATGRRPNLDGLGLEAARIEYAPHGIVVDQRLKTTNKRVYAIGDVTGRAQFTHAANYHAGLVIRNALFRQRVQMNEDAIPRVTFTDPELAHTGLTEAQARSRGHSICVLRWPYHENDRAQTERETIGHIKVITDKKGRLLGTTIVGASAGELITAWTLAISQNLNIRAFAGIVVPYPTLAEIGKRAAMTYFSPRLTSPWVRRIIVLLRLFR